ncbi:MAG: hypothetical protein ACLQU1_13010 [Bryobacteraceae bacterium]
MKVDLSFLAGTACALLLAVPLTAANGPAAKTNNNTNKNMTAATAIRSAWPPETLSGKISMVDPDRKMVVVETPDGIPFDMVLTARTRIKSGDRAITLKELTGDMNKAVSVKFTPERRGDVARSIEIGG